MKVAWEHFEKYTNLILDRFSFLDPDLKSKMKVDYGMRMLFFIFLHSTVRIVWDRKQIFVAIGKGDGKWFDLGYVALTKSPTLDFSYHYIEDEEDLRKEVEYLSELTEKYAFELIRGDFSIEAAYQETARQWWQKFEEKCRKASKHETKSDATGQVEG